MDKYAIVGGGFSAFMSWLREPDLSIIITPSQCRGNRNKYLLNKAFADKADAFAKFNLNSSKVSLHERTILGGNSSIWGGFIDTNSLSEVAMRQLQKSGVELVPLSISRTGSCSNNPFIHQLQTGNRILDVSKYIKPQIDHRVVRLGLKKNKIELVLDDNRCVEVDKVRLCVGVVQLLEILIKSSIINPGDVISMKEFPMRYKMHIGSSSKFQNSVDCIIRYGIFRAINHIFGVQRCSNKEFFATYVDQYFLNEPTKLIMAYRGNFFDVLTTQRFGGSIHYSDLRINEVPVNEFLRQFHNNIQVNGMASVNQGLPGPVSNCIVNAIFNNEA